MRAASFRATARRSARAALATLALAGAAAALPAQSDYRAPEDPFPFGGGSLRVSVLTFGPGDAVFERFGHNAIRIQDGMTGMDLAWNWGMFSFDEPQFLQRFLSGDNRYWVQPFPSSRFIEAYAAQDRLVTEQVLWLTTEQRTALAKALVEMTKPEHRFYRYDYFRDNCSTRVRDALDAVLGGSLERRFSVMTTEWTYRSEAVRLTTPAPLAQAGIELALGAPADARMTAWQAMYVPMRLRDYLRQVTVAGPDGTPIPLVITEQVVYEAKRAAEPAERRGLALGALGPVLGIWMLLLAPVSAAWGRRTRVPAAAMAVAWFGLTGLAGLAILLMWLFSAHVFWADNANLLLVSPVGLVAAWPVARAILAGRSSPMARWGAAAILAQVLVALLVWPVITQPLAGPIFLLAPAHLCLLVAFAMHVRPGRAEMPAPAAEAS